MVLALKEIVRDKMKPLDELIETFERLVTTYDAILEIARAKHSHLLSSNIEGLEMVLYQEKNQIEIAQLLEEKRQHIFGRYCREQGLMGNKITMRLLMARMDTLHREKVNSLFDRLTQSIKQIQSVNEINAALTRFSLETTEGILDIFCPKDPQYPIYQSTGKMQGRELSTVLIDTEI